MSEPDRNEQYEIDISSEQNVLVVDFDVLRQAVIVALQVEGVAAAVLSISIVDDATIHQINRDHLNHDFPTDVISFGLDHFEEVDDEVDENAGHENDQKSDNDESVSADRARGAVIEGEVIASAEMAVNMAPQAQWSPLSELILYVIHGVLHICGYDDLTEPERQMMRSREQAVLEKLNRD